MEQPDPNGLFAMVELNYQGVFTRNLFSYTGGVKTMFNDVDFSSMTFSECVTFFERFMHEEVKKMYYCEPGLSPMDGLHPISDDVEFAAFIFDAYGTDGVIYVYIDHVGVGVDGWFDDEEADDDHESCIDGENEDNIDELRNGNVEFNEDAVIMNRTLNDPFLNKLCVDEVGRDANDKIYPIAWVVVDTTQNDFQATHNDSESSSPGGCAQYLQVTPPRSYEDEDFVGEDVEVENVAGGQGEANGVVEDGQGQANGVVEDGQGQANGVFEDGQGIVNVVVEETVEVPNVKVQQVRPISDILKRIRRRKS
ncbi:unnamed protein product [Lactuca virosa]|uniref:PB1-like domain-containing protein n=1 Tax=Lactuca virosa TaxID=75947 RepID=A0AAU9PVC3_9ASTR|nr:unnamed protein product [Lactuca virosa]